MYNWYTTWLDTSPNKLIIRDSKKNSITASTQTHAMYEHAKEKKAPVKTKYKVGAFYKAPYGNKTI